MLRRTYALLSAVHALYSLERLPAAGGGVQSSSPLLLPVLPAPADRAGPAGMRVGTAVALGSTGGTIVHRRVVAVVGTAAGCEPMG